jgi:hypothetical protein
MPNSVESTFEELKKTLNKLRRDHAIDFVLYITDPADNGGYMGMSNGIKPFLGKGLTASWFDGLVAMSRFQEGQAVLGRSPQVACTEVELPDVLVIELLVRLMKLLSLTNAHVSIETNSIAQYKILVPWWTIDIVVNVRVLTLEQCLVLLKSLCAWHYGRDEAIKHALAVLELGTVPEKMCLTDLMANAFAGDACSDWNTDIRMTMSMYSTCACTSPFPNRK